MSGPIVPLALLGGGAALFFLLSRSDNASAAPHAPAVPTAGTAPGPGGAGTTPAASPTMASVMVDINDPAARTSTLRLLLDGRDPAQLDQMASLLSANGSPRMSIMVQSRGATLRTCAQSASSAAFGNLPTQARAAVVDAVVNGVDPNAIDLLAGSLDQNVPTATRGAAMLRERSAHLRMAAQFGVAPRMPSASLPSLANTPATTPAIPTVSAPISAPAAIPIPPPGILDPSGSTAPSTPTAPSPAPSVPAGPAQGTPAAVPDPVAAVAQVLAQIPNLIPGAQGHGAPSAPASPAPVPGTTPNAPPGPSTSPPVVPSVPSIPSASPPAPSVPDVPPAAPGSPPAVPIPNIPPVPASAPQSQPQGASVTIPGLGTIAMPSLPGLPPATPASTPGQVPTLPAALPAGQVALYDVAKDDFPIKIVERFTGKQTKKGLSDLAAANPTIGKRIAAGKIYANSDTLVLPTTWPAAKTPISHATGKVRMGSASEATQ